MCMIAYRPAGKGNIPSAVIDTAISRHSDGFGVAYRVKGSLVTEKFGPDQRKAFRKALKRVDRAGGEYVAHFRFATHGPHDAAHAHPYEYEHPEDGRVLVFHNGVIGIRTEPSESDTEVFVRDVLAVLPSRWWESGALRYLVNEAIGWSKLVLMTATETISLHEKRGDWDGGLWYSSDHKPAKVYSSGTAYSGGRYGRWDNDTQKWVPAATSMSGTATTLPKPITSIVPYTASAAMSAASMGLLEPLAAEVLDGYEHITHGGHTLTALKRFDLSADGDYEDSVICDNCRTIGTVYVIDGGRYIDMAHMTPEDDDDDLLHATDEAIARLDRQWQYESELIG